MQRQQPEKACQAKFLTSANFLTYDCLSVIFSQIKEIKFDDYFFDMCCVN